MGVPEHKLFFTPYCVENDRFRNEYIKLKDRKVEIRNKLNIDKNNFVILFSGKLIQKKRPLDLLKAYHHLNKEDSTLIFLGDGELRNQIENYCQRYDLNNVIITGFKNQTEISDYYIVSDVFVLPSGIGETWGLVVNEALNFNLPVIVSDLPGSAYDLIVENKNGYIFKTGDINELKEHLEFIYNNKNLLSEFGVFSGSLIKEYSYQKVITGILNAAKNNENHV